MKGTCWGHRSALPLHTWSRGYVSDMTDPNNSEGGVSGADTAAAKDSESTSPVSTEGSGAITADQARIALRRVKDPELNLNIVDLGLVYDVSVDGTVVRIDMSLTSPGCPSGPEIMGEAEQQLRTIPGVSDVVVNLIWTPPWTPDRIEPRVRAYMGF